MTRRQALAVAFLVGVVGCGPRDAVAQVTAVAADDQRMTAAIEKARATVKVFVAALKEPKAGQVGFSVKLAFTDGASTEHMWLSPVTFDGKVFQGTVNNQPRELKTVKLGQMVTVKPSEISDWMYVDRGRLVGGETLRAIRAALPATKQAEFDKSLPFAID